jgi:hypothetical protein
VIGIVLLVVVFAVVAVAAALFVVKLFRIVR